jgi:hypothetical protein
MYTGVRHEGLRGRIGERTGPPVRGRLTRIAFPDCYPFLPAPEFLPPRARGTGPGRAAQSPFPNGVIGGKRIPRTGPPARLVRGPGARGKATREKGAVFPLFPS